VSKRKKNKKIKKRRKRGGLVNKEVIYNPEDCMLCLFQHCNPKAMVNENDWQQN